LLCAVSVSWRVKGYGKKKWKRTATMRFRCDSLPFIRFSCDSRAFGIHIGITWKSHADRMGVTFFAPLLRNRVIYGVEQVLWESQKNRMPIVCRTHADTWESQEHCHAFGHLHAAGF
jgi:hypothetical protein